MLRKLSDGGARRANCEAAERTGPTVGSSHVIAQCPMAGAM